MVKNIIIQDAYGIRYEVEYVSKNIGESQIVDVTTKTYDPRIYGSEPSGYILNNKLYVNGIVSITRQVCRIEDDGYTILAEGGDSFIAEMQVSGIIPTGNFVYDYNNCLLTECESSIDSGSALVDIDDTLNSCIWSDIDISGNFLPSSLTALEFTDVW